MAKPSIFSSDYHRKMRRRKKFIIIAVILSIIVILLLAFASSVKSNSNKSSFNLSKIFNFSSTKINNNSDSQKPAVTTPNTASTKKEEAYAITLSSGKQIKAVYENKNGAKAFKYISPEDSAVNYSISPSGKNIIVFDDKTQSMIFMDIDGNKQDITNSKYVSTSGTTFDKNTVLAAKPDYIWCSTPKFIDDDNIAYVSQLPWFNKTSKYVWVENLKNKSCTQIQTLTGEDVKLDILQSKGLPVILDGVTKFISANGVVTQ